MHHSTLSAVSSNFGYYGNDDIYGRSYLRNCEFLDDQGDSTIPNLMNFMGYIPGFAMGTAMTRLGFCKLMEDASVHARTERGRHNFKALKTTQAIRGAIEFCGAGAIFLIPDLLISISRHTHHTQYHPRQQNANRTKNTKHPHNPAPTTSLKHDTVTSF